MNGRITIFRGSSTFGPYDQAQISYYLLNNRVLLHDQAQIEGSSEIISLSTAMQRCGWPIPTAKNPLESIRKIGLDFIFPWSQIRAMAWLKEKRFLFLAIIGLVPLAIVVFSASSSITYLAIATYFSILWGLFFYYIFQKSCNAQLKKCVLCYVFTALLSTSAVILVHLFGFLNLADTLSHSGFFPLRFIGMFFAAGLPEEIGKAAIIFYLVRRTGSIYMPQEVVLYGLFSGLGFGISEGIMYQMGINSKQGVDMAYFLNVLRLTSLPFLHAVWCGISSYFIGFAALFPMSRHGLWTIAILIPATLHALYNSTGMFSIIPALLAVLLFTIYLANSRTMKQKLM